MRGSGRLGRWALDRSGLGRRCLAGGRPGGLRWGGGHGRLAWSGGLGRSGGLGPTRFGCGLRPARTGAPRPARLGRARAARLRRLRSRSRGLPRPGRGRLPLRRGGGARAARARGRRFPWSRGGLVVAGSAEADEPAGGRHEVDGSARGFGAEAHGKGDKRGQVHACVLAVASRLGGLASATLQSPCKRAGRPRSRRRRARARPPAPELQAVAATPGGRAPAGTNSSRP